MAVCYNAPRINKLNNQHKREHHFFTFVGTTIFSIRVSPMCGSRKVGREISNIQTQELKYGVDNLVRRLDVAVGKSRA